jgi:drug/metabolite transporter (DMT)-like permease
MQWHAYIAVAVGLLSLSIAPLWIRYAQGAGVPSLVIAAFRMSLAALLLTPIALGKYSEQIRTLRRRDLLWAGTAGFWLAVSFTSFFMALEHIGLMLNEVIGDSSPLWVALLEVIFLKARHKRAVWIGLAVALSGGALVTFSGSNFSIGHNPAFGGLLSLTGAVSYGIYLVIGRNVRTKVALVPYVWLVYGCAGIITMIAVFFTRMSLTGYSSEGYFWVLMLVLIPQFIGHSAYNYALGYLSATFISVTGQLSIITSGLLGLIFFGEIPTALQIVASVAIVIGVMCVSLAQPSAIQLEAASDSPR